MPGRNLQPVAVEPSATAVVDSLTTTHMFSSSTLYYQLKPLIPRSLQIKLRRALVQRKRKKCEDVWPIDERATRPPAGWQGWPDGKKFALVLTHDVDTQRGHDRVRELAELETKLGFRSSFNFVPRRYDVSADLRRYLTDNGFEVGVHGLYHDGMYFKSRDIFRKRAEGINQYLKEWQCSGFRCPSMLHNLEWMHDLDIQYDASTFDTDPFEPQPEGDFTLFVLMGERDITIWKQKLDWIAEKGGMALLNVHPDYTSFDTGGIGAEDYPADYYRDFLSHVRKRFEGDYWHALPRDVAHFWPKSDLATKT
jgi:hypothetical protein